VEPIPKTHGSATPTKKVEQHQNTFSTIKTAEIGLHNGSHTSSNLSLTKPTPSVALEKSKKIKNKNKSKNLKRE
jgi:hypothetical protein